MEERGIEYYAFISYQRKDEKWADWLRSKLEHYHLPSSLRKKDASLPKEIRPIFRDALELAGGILAEEIQTALHQSKYLIVICSPNSAKSPWVDKEIQTFIHLGRTDCIIPFIIDGTPFSNNHETECFPPELCSLKGEQELLGININELGRDAAAIKVVARMFGLKFDSLWQRFERENKRRRRLFIGGALLLAITGLGIGIFFVRQNRIIKNQGYELEDAARRLRDDSVLLTNHIHRIQEDSILLWEQSDSLQKVNYQLINAFDTISHINQSLTLRQAQIVSNYGLDLLDHGYPTEARSYVKNFIHSNNSINIFTPQMEHLLRQLYFLDKGIGRQLVDKFQLQSYEDFVDDPEMMTLGCCNSSIYFSYDGNIWEYNTKKHELNLVFDGPKPIESPLTINAFSPKYNKVYVTHFLGGNLIAIHIPSGDQKLTKSSSPIQMNADGSYGLTFPSASTFQLWDISTDRLLEEHVYEGKCVQFVSNDIIEITTMSDEKRYYKIPGFILIDNELSINKPDLDNYDLQMNDTSNVLSIYRNSEVCEQKHTINSEHFQNTNKKPLKKLIWDKKTYRSIIPELPNWEVPYSLSPYSYSLSPNQQYAIIESIRGSFYLINIKEHQVIKCFSDFDILGHNLCALFWDNNNHYIGVSSESKKGEDYIIFILDLQHGDVVLKFNSYSYDACFSSDGQTIILAGQLIPFPKYDKIFKYFAGN